jgi:hypothetical protein
MTTSAIETAPRATDVSFSTNELIVHLADGRTIIVPLNWYPRLFNATPEQRAEYRLIGDGEYINWPQVDEDLTVAGLLRGTPAPNSGRRTSARADVPR